MQRWLLQIFVLASLVYGIGCTADKPTYTPDDSTPTPDSASTCAPSLSDPAFYQYETPDGIPAIEIVVSYELQCDAEIDGSVLRVKLTDKDAQENGGKNYTSNFDFVVKVDVPEEETKYVTVDTSEATLTLQYELLSDSQTTTTYEFDLKLVDTNGYVGDEVSGTAVYVDLDPAP